MFGVLIYSSRAEHAAEISSASAAPLSADKKKWTSMLTINPSKVLKTLIRRGGLFIPKTIDNDIDILRAVISCESTELNVVEKRMVLYNFRLGLPNRPASLRIGRVFLHWDSYRRPTLDIEVDDVDVIVEFTNLVLTRNNWNELGALGFPPTFSEKPPPGRQSQSRNRWGKSSSKSATAKKPTPTEANSNDFIRFHHIDLSGNATIRIRSRPLNKDLGFFSVDMDLTDELARRIGERSASNLEQTGRLGCNAAQLSKILQNEVNKHVMNYVSHNLKDIVDDPGVLSRGFDDMLNRASEYILSYASQASRKKGSDVSEGILSRVLESMGLEALPDELAVWSRQALERVARRDTKRNKKR